MIAVKALNDKERILTDRRNYSPEFKTKVAMAVLSEQKTVAQLSEEYEIPPTVIHNWLRQAQNYITEGFTRKSGKGKNKV